ncbi:MAG: hypothetical protein EAY81_03675 [Bacteroidetes bacterium]|nr:MAG: hypothetical protein EAY81_03675 [Bacteroidota bacterium]
MKLRVTLTVIFLASFIFVFAQESSGYLGKRTLLGVTTTLSPAFGNLLSSSDFNQFNTNRDFLLPPLRIGLYAAYANQDYSMWQLSISYQKMEVMRNVQLGYSSINNEIIKSLTSKAIFITGGRTWYLGGTTAPLGKYFTYNLIMAIVDAEKVNASTNNTTKLERRFDAGCNLILGTRRAITNRVIIDLGIEYNLLIVGWAIMDSSDALADTNLTKNFLNNIMGLRTGIYYLL